MNKVTTCPNCQAKLIELELNEPIPFRNLFDYLGKPVWDATHKQWRILAYAGSNVRTDNNKQEYWVRFTDINNSVTFDSTLYAQEVTK